MVKHLRSTRKLLIKNHLWKFFPNIPRLKIGNLAKDLAAEPFVLVTFWILGWHTNSLHQWAHVAWNLSKLSYTLPVLTKDIIFLFFSFLLSFVLVGWFGACRRLINFTQKWEIMLTAQMYAIKIFQLTHTLERASAPHTRMMMAAMATSMWALRNGCQCCHG